MAIAHTEAAEAQRHHEAKTQRDSIQALVNQPVAVHQDSFWRDSRPAFAQTGQNKSAAEPSPQARAAHSEENKSRL